MTLIFSFYVFKAMTIRILRLGFLISRLCPLAWFSLEFTKKTLMSFLSPYRFLIKAF
ncbi:hypothetical protein MGAS9429_Spy1293 [Streptococcus pyogenes MGAS9429]|uniref:Uncharacterized protein n=1 Tax=Streptococcus pyogenes serotype M12 (strain MGAS9429) TaxID=370551 RepID=Q1JKT9_STRPC|nr:hypothetical protein MGAS9429_Spy1293 [Streptococcus pyogenes MGAS9429]